MYLFRSDFSSCSESAGIWHANSFCVKKNVPVKKAEKRHWRGMDFQERVCMKPLCPACGKKKNRGTFFNTKRVGMPNFSRFQAT